jgi:hypothetical protein
VARELINVDSIRVRLMNEEMRGSEWSCSPNQWKEFTSTGIWREMKEILSFRLTLIRDALESSANVADLQGAARELRFVLNLPEALADPETEGERKEVEESNPDAAM